MCTYIWCVWKMGASQTLQPSNPHQSSTSSSFYTPAFSFTIWTSSPFIPRTALPYPRRYYYFVWKNSIQFSIWMFQNERIVHHFGKLNLFEMNFNFIISLSSFSLSCFYRVLRDGFRQLPNMGLISKRKMRRIKSAKMRPGRKPQRETKSHTC